MRPKFVILFFVVVLGLLAVIVAFKSDTGKVGIDSAGQAPASERIEEASTAATNLPVVPVNPNSSNTVALLEQMRAAEVEKELDQIRELESEGTGSETIPMILLTKVTHPEGEVRKAAVQALKHLDATNAIPGLEQAVALIKDPREKVAIMDVIDYLKLPYVGSEVSPATDGDAANAARPPNPKPRAPNPNRQPGAGNRSRQPSRPLPPVAPPASVDQIQPPTPAPPP